MMRADDLNSQVYPLRTEMTDPSSYVFSTDKNESKGIIVHKHLSQNCSTDKDESKCSIVNKTLSQNCSADKEKVSSTEEDKSECTITEQRGVKNEVTYDVPDYFNVFNVFECGRKLLDKLDVSYERAYMATPKEK